MAGIATPGAEALGAERWVGGRHDASLPPPGGGGYQDVCTDPATALGAPGAAPRSDPRLRELQRMGLSRAWLRVADTIGFDPFMSAWGVLARSDLDDRGRVVVPKISTYMRFQRNLQIRTMAAEGVDQATIRERVELTSSPAPSMSHIARIIAHG